MPINLRVTQRFQRFVRASQVMFGGLSLADGGRVAAGTAGARAERG
jgi:hypothetical protein